MAWISWTQLYFLATYITLSSTAPSQFSTVPGVQQDGKPMQHMPEWLFRDGSKKINWKKIAEDRLDHMTKSIPITPTRAKNVILFIGDGLGPSTVSAARYYSMQKYQKTLAFDYFPISGQSKTYNVDSQVPDSAGTATAFLCGEKTKKTLVGVNQDTIVGECSDLSDKKLESIMRRAIQQNKWAGVVTTTRVTHATPAATYAYAAHRDWESDLVRDRKLAQDPLLTTTPAALDTTKCPDIASQLIDDPINKKIRVILGGGRANFYPNVSDPEYPELTGLRGDNRTLPEVWRRHKINMGIHRDKVKYVWKKDDFDAVNPANVEYLLGLFEYSHMQFEANREEDKAGEPSIADMVEKAVRILRRSKDGFFLLVEGGRIDHAHHINMAAKALEETYALSEAIQRAQALTSEEDTLIVSSADHSHVLAFNGYNYISNDITGLVKSMNGTNELANDQKPYTVLSYTNGPGFLNHRTNFSSENSSSYKTISEDEIHPRINLTDNSVGHEHFYYDAAVYLNIETHAGEDVGVYASGPMAHLFTGTYEQHYIAHAMMYASCIKPYDNRKGCREINSSSDKSTKCPSSTTAPSPYILGVLLIQIVIYFNIA